MYVFMRFLLCLRFSFTLHHHLRHGVGLFALRKLSTLANVTRFKNNENKKKYWYKSPIVRLKLLKLILLHGCYPMIERNEREIKERTAIRNENKN